MANVVSSLYDPRERCCAWCYGPGVPTLHKCPKCPRAYCSRACQLADYKKSGGCHKFWCSKSGEKCVDYEIRDADGDKGLGLFAKRDFVRGEKILVERAVLVHSADGRRSLDRTAMDDNENIKKAVMSLTPVDAGIHEKFRLNSVAMDDTESKHEGGSGIFILSLASITIASVTVPTTMIQSID